MKDPEIEKMTKMSRRSFLWAGAAVLGAGTALRWINHSPMENDIVGPLRRIMAFEDEASRPLVQGFSPTVDPKRRNENPRVNAYYGEPQNEIAPEDWSLDIHQAGPQGEASATLNLAALKAMPKLAQTTEFHCVEGWTEIISWVGVRLSDILKQYPHAPGMNPRWVELATDDGEYYVAIDLESAKHPQTILAYEMNDAPVPHLHGGPVRLVIPTKYGVKNIKWVGTLVYHEDRPGDYWGERGYDWFLGQ